ncbi:MAG: hypothetical protein GY850_03960 [bacterium]|nr:hypothetical protein [bacterium]
MENVMVIGAGFMGSRIARVCAQSGYRVILMDMILPHCKRPLGG